MSTINKTDIINSVASSAKINKADAQRALEAIIDVIQKGLKKGEEIRLTNFGTFKVTERKATTGRNPRTGAAIKIPAKKQPKFTPGKALKEMVAS